MSIRPAAVRADFDRIAQALAWSNDGYLLSRSEHALLRYLPRPCGRVLDVGCGDGTLTRQVARCAQSVLALDLSPDMVSLARARSSDQHNVEYEVADVTETELPVEAFDVVLSVAMLHHVPLEPTIARLAAAVRHGGLLLIQDLVHRPGVRYLPVNALGWIDRQISGVLGRRSGAHSASVAAMYRAHGAGEEYLTPAEAARVYPRLLPGARIVHHLSWRYTVIWRRAGKAYEIAQPLERSAVLPEPAASYWPVRS